MPTRRRAPRAAALQAIIDRIDATMPPDVSVRIREYVFPRNSDIMSAAAEARDTIQKARDSHHEALHKIRYSQPGWGSAWNRMVTELNTAKRQVHDAAAIASSREHAPMLKGKKRQFTKKALDFEVEQGWEWPAAYLDNLDAKTDELVRLTGVPDEDVEWSRAAKWADNVAGERRTRRRRHRRKRQATRKRPRRNRSQRKR